MTLHRINPILYQIMTHKIHYSDFNLKRILAHNANAKMDEMRLLRDSTWAPFAESHPEEMEADTDRNIAPGLASERWERWRRPIRVKLSHTGREGTPCFNGETGLLISRQAGARFTATGSGSDTGDWVTVFTAQSHIFSGMPGLIRSLRSPT